jgi:hypothetical protein
LDTIYWILGFILSAIIFIQQVLTTTVPSPGDYIGILVGSLGIGLPIALVVALTIAFVRTNQSKFAAEDSRRKVLMLRREAVSIGKQFSMKYQQELREEMQHIEHKRDLALTSALESYQQRMAGIASEFERTMSEITHHNKHI